jgi:hypothetical protein
VSTGDDRHNALSEAALLQLLALADADVAAGRTRSAAEVLAQMRKRLADLEQRLDATDAQEQHATRQDMATAFHLLAGMPEDSDGRREQSIGELERELIARLRQRLNARDARERLTGLMAARGRADVQPIAGGDIELDLRCVLAFAELITGDPAQARAWLDVPMPDYDHLTPRELVERGRADTVLQHIVQIMSGASG